jgi:hypothetical protein
MKPAGNIHRLPVIDSWQRQPQIKNPLVNRLKNITCEIHAIQAEMHNQLNEPTSGSRISTLFENEDVVRVLNDFKAELDQLRRILWFYIEQASIRSSAAMDIEQQDKRRQRVNELLRTLAAPPTSALAGQNTQPSISFFERLDVVIDTYMQEKKPVIAAKAQAAKASD